MKKFTNLYPVQKTLRFELIPQGNTSKHLCKIIQEDEQIAEDSQEVKKLLDRYHKDFIAIALSSFPTSPLAKEIIPKLKEFAQIRTTGDAKQISTIQDELRELVVKGFKGEGEQERRHKILIGAKGNPNADELFNTELINFLKDPAEQALVKKFQKHTGYFLGFNENRKNMYSAKAQSTAIAYRLIHENLPRFLDNITTYEKVKTCLKEEIPQLEKELALAGASLVSHVDSVFTIDFFLEVFTQSGIDQYNALIGKIVNQEQGEVKGLNERINLYNQQHKQETKLPLFKPLYKQILSDREQLSWLAEAYNSDKDLLDSIQKYYQLLIDNQIFERIPRLMHTLEKAPLDKIWITYDTQLTSISNTLYGSWRVIGEALGHNAKSEKERKNSQKKALNYSLESINQAIAKMPSDEELPPIQKYFIALGSNPSKEEASSGNLVDKVRSSYKACQNILTNPDHTGKKLIQDKKQVDLLKQLLDDLLILQRFIKPLLYSNNENETHKDEEFYTELTDIMDLLNPIVGLYNKVRNYLTQKPYSTEKFKINFKSSSLLAGWDRNKERDNLGVILKREDKYYLAIMDKAHNATFKNKSLPTQGECYEKMEYKLLPGANKMLPKVYISSKKGIESFHPSEELQKKYKLGTHKKGASFNLSDMRALIDYFKECLEKHEEHSQFGFHFSDTSTYEDISGFYREVEQQAYKITFRKVSVEYIDQLVNEGKLYLFQIYNKDFSPYSKGTPNLHTLYWKMLFDPANLQDIVYKLNGEAEVFFRKKSLQYDRPTHPKGQPINKKSLLNEGETSLFDYDLIKDRRFTVDKFQFHVPITMNFKATQGTKVNQMVQEEVKKSKGFHLIGIDRGERNLLYIVVINERGEIIEQCSLNKIVNTYQEKEHTVDYKALLEKRSQSRLEERKSWQTIENIKELKGGYLSQVVHKIAQLMIKYNAIAVLEDLNFGFIRTRKKFEFSVYQEFEKKLIDKLGYVVDKKAPIQQEGGLLQAYQLTAPFKSFREMGKQNGFLFYVPAWNTSAIDPRTGFVNLLDTRYESIAKTKELIKKLKDIRYNSQKDWFEIDLDYNAFGNRAKGSRSKWRLCSYGERIEHTRKQDSNGQEGSDSMVVLTEAFKDVFTKYQIDYRENLKEQLLLQSDKAFFVDFLSLLRLTLQLRNSLSNSLIDYILSPVADENGEFFDSRKALSNEPQDADANGAYHIALKGLWVLDKIRKTEKVTPAKLALSNQEWLSFAQEKPFFNE